MPADQSDRANEFSPDLLDTVRLSDLARAHALPSVNRQPRVESAHKFPNYGSLRIIKAR